MQGLSANPRLRKCKTCRNRFTPRNSMQVVCSLKCAVEHGRKDLAQQQRRAKTEGRKRLMTRSDWTKRAQVAFNRWVKMRDADLPCVSCGRFHEGQWHAGHYLSTGARPELRFEPLNVWKQCQPCNTHLSGNLVLYRAELVRRIGLEAVEKLESDHQPRKYTIEELKALTATYRAKANALQKATKEAA